jgi:hypothetical protein
MDEKKKQAIEEIAGISYSIFTADNHCPFDKDCPYLGGKVRFGCNDCLRANLIIDAGYRKESDTVREILTELKPIIINYLDEYMENGSEEAPKYFENLCKKYGVDLGE